MLTAPPRLTTVCALPESGYFGAAATVCGFELSSPISGQSNEERLLMRAAVAPSTVPTAVSTAIDVFRWLRSGDGADGGVAVAAGVSGAAAGAEDPCSSLDAKALMFAHSAGAGNRRRTNTCGEAKGGLAMLSAEEFKQAEFGLTVEESRRGFKIHATVFAVVITGLIA
jgi:hypothetical protein